MYRKETEGWLKHYDFILLDLICLHLAFILAYATSGQGWNPYEHILYRNMAIYLTLVDLLAIFSMDTLKSVLKRGTHAEFLFTSRHVVALLALSLLYLFVLQQGSAYSRLALFLTFILYAALTWIFRLLWKQMLVQRRAAGGERSLLIVTASDIAEDVIENIKKNNYAGYTIAGAVLIDDGIATEESLAETLAYREAAAAEANAQPAAAEANAQPTAAEANAQPAAAEANAQPTAAELNAQLAAAELNAQLAAAEVNAQPTAAEANAQPQPAAEDDLPARTIAGIPVVAGSEKAAMYVCKEWIDEVILVPSDSLPFPQKLLDELQETGVTLHLNLARVSNEPGKKQFVEKVGGYTVLTTSINYASAKQLVMKRAMDIAAGILGCILTGVLFFFVAPVIYIKSPGPIFFSQERVGKNGKKFKLYKFRSMYLDADARKAELMKENRLYRKIW